MTLLLAGLPAAAVANEPTRIDVKVDRHGERMVVALVAHVRAPLADAWAVLTDYEHMPVFTTSITHCAVLQRQGNQLQVAQTTENRIALLKLKVSSVRAIELLPMREIKSRLVSGDFKAYDSVTRLSTDARGTLIEYNGEYISKNWIPPMLGPSMIADQIKKHYGQILAEVLRRRQGDAVASPAMAASGSR